MADQAGSTSSDRLEAPDDTVDRLIELAERLLTTFERETNGELRRCLSELELMHSALLQAPDFQYVKDRSSRLVGVNQAVAKFHGFSHPSEMIGLTDFDIDGPTHAALLFAAEQQIMESGQALVDFEEFYTGPSGQVGWFATSKVPLLNAEGKIIGLAGVTRDITARKLAAILRDEQARILELIATSAPLDLVLQAIKDLVEKQIPGSSCHILLRRETGGEATADDLALPSSEPDRPIRGHDGTVLGWLSLSADLPDGDPSSARVIEEATRLASIAIERKRAEERIWFLAHCDPLTGLPNRKLFEARLTDALASAATEHLRLAVVFVDLDRFKAVNDNLGHAAGDELIKAIAARLAGSVQVDDTVARFGGDEFILLLKSQSATPDRTATLLQAIRDRVAEPIEFQGERLQISCSLGVATYPQDGSDGLALIRTADAAMYQAKHASRQSSYEQPEPAV